MESKVSMGCDTSMEWRMQGLITNLPGELHAGGVHDAGIGELDHIARQQAGACLAQVQPAVEIALREGRGRRVR